LQKKHYQPPKASDTQKAPANQQNKALFILSGKTVVAHQKYQITLQNFEFDAIYKMSNDVKTTTSNHKRRRH